VAVKINGKKRDGQVEQILRDPRAYFAQARKTTREAVRADVARERGRLRRRTA
jgi:hypothetical protein